MAVSIEQYYREARAADWQYDYADGEAYRRGLASVQAVARQADNTPQHRQVYYAMKAAALRGAAWPTLESIVDNLDIPLEAPEKAA